MSAAVSPMHQFPIRSPAHGRNVYFQLQAGIGRGGGEEPQ
jgi:hypothetical protein